MNKKVHISWIFVAGMVGLIIGTVSMREFDQYIINSNKPEFTYHEIKMTGDSATVMVNGKISVQPLMEYVEGLQETWTRHLVSTKGKDSSILFTLVKK